MEGNNNMKKNLKDLTPDELEQYSSEIAQKIFKDHPFSSNDILNMDYQHPLIEPMFGILWDGPERNEWLTLCHEKYDALKAEARKLAPKFEGFDDVGDLAKIKKPEDIKELVIEDQYEDDHLQCATVRINGVSVGFHYYDDLGFLKYWDDSPRALTDLLDAIKTSIAAWEEEMDIESGDRE